jgi:COMPASS component SWD2
MHGLIFSHCTDGAAPQVCSTLSLLPALAGREDKSIAVWSVETKQEVARWFGHTGLPTVLKWSPRRMLVASAESNLALWIPNLQQLPPAGGMQLPPQQ